MVLPNLDMSHLGPDATEADVSLFREAVSARMDQTGCDETAASEWLWGDGDWYGRAESVTRS